MASPVETVVPTQEKNLEDGPDTDSADAVSKQGDDGDDYETHYMSGFKLHLLLAGLTLAVFIMALDMSILVTAIPLITEKFQSTEDIGWYIAGYFLTVYVLCPWSQVLCLPVVR